MTVKAGQKCTAIRKALVPAAMAPDVIARLHAALSKIIVGDPRSDGVRMGPLVSLEQRKEVLARLAELRREADLVAGNPDEFAIMDADRERGAFVPPLLLSCREPHAARAVHEVEAFGPVATVVPYRERQRTRSHSRGAAGEAWWRRCSAPTMRSPADSCSASRLYHGRILVANARCAQGVDRPRFAARSAGARRPGPGRRR